MRIYEIGSKGHEEIKDIYPEEFDEQMVYSCDKNDIRLLIDYDLECRLFVTLDTQFSVLLEDIHNNIPCGTLRVTVPVGDVDTDEIIHIVHFNEKEFEKLKNLLDKVTEMNYNKEK